MKINMNQLPSSLKKIVRRFNREVLQTTTVKIGRQEPGNLRRKKTSTNIEFCLNCPLASDPFLPVCQ
jgi:hypothetical protein